ncbi:MAG: glycoside hydrolase family 15 protein [Acidobacteriaceae bacterium]
MDRQIEMIDVTRPAKERRAAGKPGTKPTWSSGAKTIVGTAASERSRVWYTVGLGTINEIYFADIEQANTRSVRFLVSDGSTFFSDEAWDAEHRVSSEAGVPYCRIESRCKAGRYSTVKEIVLDPLHDTVLMRVQFTPTGAGDLKLYLTVDPQIGDKGECNNAWVGQYKGRPMLMAQRGAVALAVGCSTPMKGSSCGYAGKSDGCTVLSGFKPLPKSNLAEKGNVTLTTEVDYLACREKDGGRFVVAISFGTNPPEAAQEATSGLLQDFDKVHAEFVRSWHEAQETYAPMQDLSDLPLDMYRVSTAVLETHQSKRFSGGFIASLSMPWGFARSDKDIGGYHVLWPRDMVETAMGKLASGDARGARATLFFLRCTQEDSGGWSQNMFLDGTPYWTAVQMDGTALPILLADQLRRENALDGYDATPMVEAAARFLLKHGPWTGQDRWEELPGYSPYTTATEVAALLATADFCEQSGDAVGATFLRETADAWQDTIDEFTYVTGTTLAEEHGVAGYYVRMAPPKRVERETTGNLYNRMGNLPFGEKHQRAGEMVSPDALALVRFGLRAPDDERILNTIKVVDATLKRETKTGPVWVRSSKDGYGEKADGSPYEKTGIGRGWPLLAGERGHYEVAAGNRQFALELLKTMARQTSECGMIPEQVWDAPDIPEHMLYNGRPAGSSMPLVWAHAEYIKLLRSLHAGKVWDLPPQAVERYQVQKRSAGFQIWTPTQKRGWLAPGKDLRVDLPAAATLHWRTADDSGTMKTEDTGFGVYCAMLPCSAMGAKRVVVRVEPEDESGDGELKSQSFAVRYKIT